MSDPSAISFDSCDAPAAYQAADAAAMKARQAYLQTVTANVALILAGAAFAAVPATSAAAPRVWNLLSALCFAAGLGMSSVASTAERDRRWVKYRAEAEEILAAAWRFMMTADGVAALPAAGERLEVTRAMLRVRSLPVRDRLLVYLDSRIAEQRTWYENKARSSDRRARYWARGLFLSQMGALVASLAAVWDPALRFTGGPVFTAFAGVCVGWLRATQHRQLSKAYANAARELTGLAERASHVTTDEELSTIVAAAESLMVHERNTWAVRRTAV
jgi:hypothetical protein